MEADDSINVLGTALVICGTNPVTGYFREEGCGPKVHLEATHRRALDVVPLEVLLANAATADDA